jgi:hypothetical protein
VQPVGDISLYASYTASSGTKQSITVAPNTFSSVNTAIPTSTAGAGFDWQPAWLPQAPGTSSSCGYYVNASSSGLTYCDDVAEEWAITTDQFLSWNPSLPSDLSTCSLESGYSYCVQATDVIGKLSEQRDFRGLGMLTLTTQSTRHAMTVHRSTQPKSSAEQHRFATASSVSPARTATPTSALRSPPITPSPPQTS